MFLQLQSYNMDLKIALQKLRDTIRLRHLALSTEESYCAWVTRFSRFVKERCSGAELPAQKMEMFLTQLARQDVSASTQNQAFCALLFFYREVLKIEVGEVDALRAKKPSMLRFAPETHEVMAVLGAAQDVGGYPTRMILRMIYGCGLRVSEPLNLRLRDVMLSEMKLVIRGAKGGKDRFVAIPCALHAEVRAQMEFAQAVAKVDIAARVPVMLPTLLAKKYPLWQFSPKWAFLFPSRSTCVHPRTKIVVRYRCHEVNVQRAMKAATRTLGLDITPHHLRHAYATHCLNRGGNPRAIQEAMGHSNLETTMGYMHAEAMSVRSPLD